MYVYIYYLEIVLWQFWALVLAYRLAKIAWCPYT